MEQKEETSELQQLVSSDCENDDSIIQEDDTTDNTLTEVRISSPPRSAKIGGSSGNTTTSQSSISHGGHHKKHHHRHGGGSLSNATIKAGSAAAASTLAAPTGGSAAGVSTSLLYVNEKQRAATKEVPKGSAVRPRNIHKVNARSAVAPPPHHSFLSEVPDVRHMERALLGLLDDFHSGKLRAFASGCTMEQMTDIREQQERLARLHFDLGGAVGEKTATMATSTTADDPDGSGGHRGLLESHKNMSQLIQRLEQLSVSIEGLHRSSDN